MKSHKSLGENSPAAFSICDMYDKAHFAGEYLDFVCLPKERGFSPS